MDGIFNIYKEAGLRSYSVVEHLKAAFRTSKAGYAGTLDNFASGVLLCGVNQATRILKYFLTLDKEYVAVVVLGRTTNTLDPQGEVSATGRADIPAAEVESCLKTFVATFPQVPPVFSSKKIGGKRSSDLARMGQAVELKPSMVTVHSLTMEDFDASGRFTIRVRCSTGTYVRALARDIGLKLGTVAMLEKLERTANGRYPSSESRRTGDLDPERDMIPMRESLYFLDEIKLRAEAVQKAKNGVLLGPDDFNSRNLINGVYKVIFDGLLLSIVEKQDDRFLYLDNFATDI